MMPTYHCDFAAQEFTRALEYIAVRRSLGHNVRRRMFDDGRMRVYFSSVSPDLYHSINVKAVPTV